ncbi:MAG: ribosome biogenesis GTP-binding protein YihA/YsxC, partial [Clostridiales bacterium]|nr:ribosome biogenesis GTP-binding protein YihA/YsxC [Clostridiales bacterium]
MDVNYAELAATAVKPEQYPADGLPEFAFIGKSNVGKSSLLNSLAGRKALARTSGSPGKTRAINFFNINHICMFVDLPGYGYARVSRSESQKWGVMADRYLLNRGQLKSVFMLLDIRHDPTALDRQ